MERPDRRYVGRVANSGQLFAVAIFIAATLLLPLPLAILGAAGVVVVAAWDRRWPLCAVVLSIPFEPLNRPVGRYAFSPTEILIVLTTLGAAVDIVVRWIRSNRDLRQIPRSGSGRSVFTWILTAQWTPDPTLTVLVLLIVLGGAVSLTASVSQHESVQAFRLVIVEPALFYLLASSSSGHQHVARDLALSLVLAGVLISLVGFWQYAYGDRIITAEADLRRIRGFYGSPNNLGLFLGRSIPFAVSLALWPTRFRVVAGISAALMALALVLTFSIGAWVAVVASLVGVAIFRGRQAIRGAIVLGIAVAVVGAASALTVPRIGSHFDLQSSTSSIRIDVWRSALRMIADHPIRGIGLDNFLHYYQNGYRLPSAWQDPNLSHPHNVVLDFWLSLGLPGLALLGALVGRYSVVARRAWLVASNEDRALVAGSAGGMIDIMIHGFVDNSFFLPDLAMLFWLMFVIVARVADRSGKSSTL